MAEELSSRGRQEALGKCFTSLVISDSVVTAQTRGQLSGFRNGEKAYEIIP